MLLGEINMESRIDPSQTEQCNRALPFFQKEIVDNPRVRIILIAQRFDLFYDGRGYSSPTRQILFKGPDGAMIEAATRSLLVGVGEDPSRDGLLDTPARVRKSMEFLTAGYHLDPRDVVGDAFCAHCGGWPRPAAVLFTEPIQGAVEPVLRFDADATVIVAGLSGAVASADPFLLPRIGKCAAGQVFNINPAANAYDQGRVTSLRMGCAAAADCLTNKLFADSYFQK